MKFSTGLPFVAILALVATFQITFTSCSKDKVTVYDTITVKDTVTVIDTFTVKDTAITLELLTSTAWKFQEIRGVNSNTPYYYLRGGSFNTQSFDHEHILFKADKTGVVTDEGETNTPMTWDFANADKTSIAYRIPFPNGVILDTIEHVKYKNGALIFGEFFKDAQGHYVHSMAIRIPVAQTTAANVRLQ
jgi:hypothetical protein